MAEEVEYEALSSNAGPGANMLAGALVRTLSISPFLSQEHSSHANLIVVVLSINYTFFEIRN
jgi:hypothetical protein